MDHAPQVFMKQPLQPVGINANANPFSPQPPSKELLGWISFTRLDVKLAIDCILARVRHHDSVRVGEGKDLV
jgi:hypothetical protein